MTDSLFWLTLVVAFTAVLWMPYILEFMKRVGLLSALSLAEMDQTRLNATPAWAERAKSAHANAVENLIIFAPLALIAHSVGTSIVLATQIYLLARVLHYIFYVAGIGFLRTLTFIAGFFVQAYVALTVLGAL